MYRSLIATAIILGLVGARALMSDSLTSATAAANLPTELKQSDLADTFAITPPATAPTTQALAEEFPNLKGHSGFWRIGQDKNKAWWFISPKGKPEFLNTVTTVQPYQHGRDPNGPNFVSTDWDGKNDPAGVDSWADKTLARVKDVGFKGMGAWCHPIFHKLDIPMSRDLNIWTWTGAAFKRLYTPDWSTAAESAVKEQCTALHDNSNLIGYFSDNELDWGDGSSGPSVYFDGLAATDPNRLEVIKVIQTVWTQPDQFNKDWDSKIADFKELETWDHLPKEKAPKAYTRLFSAWLTHMAADYFRITTALIHKYDNNHLVLGVRFRGYAPPEVVKAASTYIDVQSLNYYVGDGLLDIDQFRMMYETGKQPVIISEYSFNALDGRSGDRNMVGFAAQVIDQRARADGYKLMTTRLARVPYIIGADWFQWMDEPPSGRSSDGEDVNFGVVDIDDRPYALLVKAIQETTPKLNDLHAQSPSDAEADIWRESFATKPVAHVPFLEKPININGELTDWPATAKLQNVRHSQAIGLERSPLPVPNVYLAWSNDGLYIGMEVFDNDIDGAPAKGWWWTKDNVEIWLSTKPVSSDQNTYDVNCHQFFVVPNDETAANGVGSVVGQWHRVGDALQDNLIPHPDIKQATRILPDRYVVEMLIPSKAMHGWDPKTQPAMAFNIHVRNFQHGVDYFWSAPKEVMTQLRPNTWGSMYLDPAPKPAQASIKSQQSVAQSN